MAAKEHVADGRRPPAAPAIRGGHAVARESASDFSEAPPLDVLLSNPCDDRIRERRRAPGGTTCRTRSAYLDMLHEEALELAHGDEPLTPRRLDGVEQRNDTAIDRRDADPEGLRSLAARVRQLLDRLGLAELARSGRGFQDGSSLPPSALSQRLPLRGHSESYSNECGG